jgi:hypothetical protein
MSLERALSLGGLVSLVAPLRASTRIDRLVAYKSDHRLEAWSGERLARTYRIAIGAGEIARAGAVDRRLPPSFRDGASRRWFHPPPPAFPARSDVLPAQVG